MSEDNVFRFMHAKPWSPKQNKALIARQAETGEAPREPGEIIDEWIQDAVELGQILPETDELGINIWYATRCLIEDKEGNAIAVGYSFCSPKDQFSRKLGRQIAQGRALRRLEAVGDSREDLAVAEPTA